MIPSVWGLKDLHDGRVSRGHVSHVRGNNEELDRTIEQNLSRCSFMQHLI